MPRPKLPLTPSASTEIAPAEYQDMTGSFELPSPVVNSNPTKPTPPASPEEISTGNPRHKRTLSGRVKIKNVTETFSLPPPPGRNRKIIQVNPTATPDVYSDTTAQQAQTKSTKRKQPSATSAAGRKMARKTAHSIIERRRRGKMNEEFGVLKDMIPACEGIEMHKLAILQAGIEYVRYLEKCIKQLKGEKDVEVAVYRHAIQISDDEDGADKNAEEDDDDDDDDDDDENEGRTSEPEKLKTKNSMDWHRTAPLSSNLSIQDFARPSQCGYNSTGITHSPSTYSIHSTSATPTPTFLSPAFNAIHFSPNISRDPNTSTTATSIVRNASPKLLPLPQASMPISDEMMKSTTTLAEDGAEATATAALMMLTNDRRGTTNASETRYKPMSVKDLLSS